MCVFGLVFGFIFVLNEAHYNLIVCTYTKSISTTIFILNINHKSYNLLQSHCHYLPQMHGNPSPSRSVKQLFSFGLKIVGRHWTHAYRARLQQWQKTSGRRHLRRPIKSIHFHMYSESQPVGEVPLLWTQHLIGKVWGALIEQDSRVLFVIFLSAAAFQTKRINQFTVKTRYNHKISK